MKSLYSSKNYNKYIISNPVIKILSSIEIIDEFSKGYIEECITVSSDIRFSEHFLFIYSIHTDLCFVSENKYALHLNYQL